MVPLCAGGGGDSIKANNTAKMNDNANLGISFVHIVIGMAIALGAFGIVTSQVNTTKGDANLSASDKTFAGLIPFILLAVLVLAAAGGLAVKKFGRKG